MHDLGLLNAPTCSWRFELLSPAHFVQEISTSYLPSDTANRWPGAITSSNFGDWQREPLLPARETQSAFDPHAQRNAFRRDARPQSRLQLQPAWFNPF
jgi:hypothetical protein